MRTGKMWDIILKKLCNKSDYIINLNEQAQSFVKRYTDTPMSIIPNFISESEIRKDEKVINEKVSRVLYVGGGIEIKGCKEFIDVAKEFLFLHIMHLRSPLFPFLRKLYRFL